jgi:dTDP-glucose 4,6-dehydratase
MSKYHSPVNIGNPVKMTIKHFAQKVLEILEITGATGGIIHKDLPVDDPKVRRPDIARARALLGWEPKVDFDKGIRLTIDYFQSSRLAKPACKKA